MVCRWADGVSDSRTSEMGARNPRANQRGRREQWVGNRGGGCLLERDGTKIATRTRRRPAAGAVTGGRFRSKNTGSRGRSRSSTHTSLRVMVRGGLKGRLPADRKCR